jgi:hypothetical protein
VLEGQLIVLSSVLANAATKLVWWSGGRRLRVKLVAEVAKPYLATKQATTLDIDGNTRPHPSIILFNHCLRNTLALRPLALRPPVQD